MKKARNKRQRKSNATQLSMLKDKVLKHFGGNLLKGNAKSARPLSTKEAVHLVLKSTQAIGTKSMLHTYNVNKINNIIRTHAKLCRIRIYHFVNVGNHLHLVIKLDFLKPFEAHNMAEYLLAESGGETEFTWAMHGPNSFMSMVMGLFFSMDKMVGAQFEQGLASLKALMEGGAR